MNKPVQHLISIALAIVLIFSGFDTLHHWKIKDDYQIKFTHVDAEGIFKKISGDIVFHENNPEHAIFNLKIDVNSVESGNPMRNESIVSDNWLDAKSYPYVTFVAKGAKKEKDGWSTVGKLNVRGIEREVQLPFTFNKSGESSIFTSSFTLKMIDHNLSDDPDEELKIELKVPVQ